jgi:UDP-3-O-[3-hydroxymyristoyl] N-acetylglucosamine deacetylase
MSVPFRTLSRAASVKGVALHSGERVGVKLLPRRECGIVFARVDLRCAPEIPARFDCIAHTTHATTLEQNGHSVATTEHLLAALWMNGITHCRIEVTGSELPIGDGSAQLWQELLDEAGTQDLDGARPIFSLREPVFVGDAKAFVLGVPHDTFRVSVAVEYGRDYLAPQTFDAENAQILWRTELAPARTFTLEEWIEPLRAAGLIQGGSEETAIVLREDGASSPLRFENELARHKALDVLGDFALLCGDSGALLNAHLVAVRAGHEWHRRWMQEALSRDSVVLMEK